MRETPHMRALCTLYRYDKLSLKRHRFTMSAIHDRCSFPTRGNARLETQTHSVTAEMMNATFDFRDTTTARSCLQRFTLLLRLLKASRFCRTVLRLYSSSASCKRWYEYHFGSRSHHKDQFLRECHLVTQASPEFKNFSANTNSSRLLSTSRRRLRQIKVPLSPSLTY